MTLMFENSVHVYKIVDGKTYVSCTDRSTLPNIYFSFRGQFIRVDIDDFLVDQSEVVDNVTAGTLCLLKIGRIDAPFNIIGTAGLIDYYVVHDWHNNTMSFSPHSTSKKPNITEILDFMTPGIDVRVQITQANAFNTRFWPSSFALLFLFGLLGLWGNQMYKEKDNNIADYYVTIGSGVVMCILGWLFFWWVLSRIVQ